MLKQMRKFLSMALVIAMLTGMSFPATGEEATGLEVNTVETARPIEAPAEAVPVKEAPSSEADAGANAPVEAAGKSAETEDVPAQETPVPVETAGASAETEDVPAQATCAPTEGTVAPDGGAIVPGDGTDASAETTEEPVGPTDAPVAADSTPSVPAVPEGTVAPRLESTAAATVAASIEFTSIQDGDIVPAQKDLKLEWKREGFDGDCLFSARNLRRDLKEEDSFIYHEDVSENQYTIKGADLEYDTCYALWVEVVDEAGNTIASDKVEIKTCAAPEEQEQEHEHENDGPGEQPVAVDEKKNPVEETEPSPSVGADNAAPAASIEPDFVAGESQPDEILHDGDQAGVSEAPSMGEMAILEVYSVEDNEPDPTAPAHSPALNIKKPSDGGTINGSEGYTVRWSCAEEVDHFEVSCKNLTQNTYICNHKNVRKSTSLGISADDMVSNCQYRLWVGGYDSSGNNTCGQTIEFETDESIEFISPSGADEVPAGESLELSWNPVYGANYQISFRNLTTDEIIYDHYSVGSGTSFVIDGRYLPGENRFRAWVGAYDSDGSAISSNGSGTEFVTGVRVGVPEVKVVDVDIAPHSVTLHAEIVSDGDCEITDYGVDNDSLGTGNPGTFEYSTKLEECLQRVEFTVYAENEYGRASETIRVYTPCCHEEDEICQETEYLDLQYKDTGSNVYHLVSYSGYVRSEVCDHWGSGDYDGDGYWEVYEYQPGMFDTLNNGPCEQVLKTQKVNESGTFKEWHSYYPTEGISINGEECEDCGHVMDCDHSKVRTVYSPYLDEDGSYKGVCIDVGDATYHIERITHADCWEICEDCGEELDYYEELGTVEYSMPHDFDEDGVCVDCGYEKNAESACRHKDVRFIAIQGAFFLRSGYYTAIDDSCHSAWGTTNYSADVYQCESCGIYLKQYDDGSYEKYFDEIYYDSASWIDTNGIIEAHNIKDGVCVDCGYAEAQSIAFLSPLQDDEVSGSEALELKWSTVNRADHYKYSARWLDQQDAFLPPERTESTNARIPADELLSGKKLELWVGAYDASGNVLAEDKITVTVAEKETQKLSVEITGITKLKDGSMAIDFEGYDIHVIPQEINVMYGTTPECNTRVDDGRVDALIFGGVHGTAILEGLAPSTLYYVKASILLHDGSYGESPVKSFTTADDIQIEITAPSDGDEVASNADLIVSWSETEKADHYEFSARYEDEEEAFIFHKKYDGGQAVISAADLIPGKTLNLWVGAYDASNTLLCAHNIQVTTAASEAPKLFSVTPPHTVVEPGKKVQLTVEANASTEYVEVYSTDSAGQLTHMGTWSNYTTGEGKHFFQIELSYSKVGDYKLRLDAVAADKSWTANAAQAEVVVSEKEEVLPQIVSVELSAEQVLPGETVSVAVTCNEATASVDMYTVLGDKDIGYQNYKSYTEDANKNRVFRIDVKFDALETYGLRFLALAADGTWNENAVLRQIVVTDDLIEPLPPIRLNVENGDIVTDEAFTFRWDAVDRASYYLFSLRDLSDKSEGNEGKLLYNMYRIERNATHAIQTALQAGHEYRVWICAVPKNIPYTSKKCSSYKADFSCRTVPQFSLTAIENDGRIGSPVTVRWNAPVWTRTPEMKPDKYIIWWYCPGLADGMAVELPGDRTSATLPASDCGYGGNYSVGVYAILSSKSGDQQRMADGDNEFTKATPEVKITYPNADNHTYLTTDGIDVSGQAQGGVKYVKVTLEKDGVELIPLSGNVKYSYVLVAEDGSFRTTLKPELPLEEGAVYAVAAYGYDSEEDLLQGKAYICNHWQKIQVNGSKTDRITLNGINGSVWIFDGQRVVVRATGNDALKDIAVTASNGSTAGLGSVEKPGKFQTTLVAKPITFAKEGRYTLDIKVDGKACKAPGSVYVVTRMDKSTWYVAADQVAVTSLPGQGRTKATASYNQTVEVIGSYGDYYCINYDGKTGFVAKDSLNRTKNVDDSGRITSPKDGAPIAFFAGEKLNITFTETKGAQKYKVALYEGSKIVFVNEYDDLQAQNGELEVSIGLDETKYFTEESKSTDHQITIVVTAITD